jgi:hypothetical protein
VKSISGFGVDWELPISEKQSKALIHDVPQMGYEIFVCAGNTGLNKHHLYVQNVSGHLVLACSSLPRSYWKEVFLCPALKPILEKTK